MDLGLAGRVYVVGGGSRGLGFAAARTLVAEGGRVVISGRDAGRLARAVRLLGDTHATGVVADTIHPASPERLADAAREQWGRLDGVLINGGGPPTGQVMDLVDDAWREAFESVFLGAVRSARVMAGQLGEGGAMVFVLSTSARAVLTGLDLSNGLRPGLAMVAKSMTCQLGPRGIRVNALLPGRITTERTAYVDAERKGADAPVTGPDRIPLGRAGDPDEFGRVAAFLLSPAASYVNGVAIPVDGGAGCMF